ncbi:MAG TPA: M15 family metallopeptidase [Pyrinomonadaceae bacterium]
MSEWYEPDEDEPEQLPTKSAPAHASTATQKLSGWGPGFYGTNLGYTVSEAPATAARALTYPQVNSQLPSSGPGFYSYYATDARGRLDSPPGYHRYALQEVVRALLSIASEWQRLHPRGPRIGFGDLSLLGGGPTPRHGAHQRGLEADIRPLRTDGREQPATYKDPTYSRVLTQQLVDVIRRNSALRVRTILFNDAGVRGVTSYAGHDNHLHVGFMPPGQGGAAPRPSRPTAAQTTAQPAPGNFDPYNTLSGLHPALVQRIQAMSTALATRSIRVVIPRSGGRRTFQEQDALYAQGRSRPGNIVTAARGGQSNHNYGLAVDIVPVVNGRLTWNVPQSLWQAIGEAGKRSGLSWGGDWTSFKDYPHFELPVGMSVQECFRIYQQRGLPAVWSEASRRLQNRR